MADYTAACRRILETLMEEGHYNTPLWKQVLAVCNKFTEDTMKYKCPECGKIEYWAIDEDKIVIACKCGALMSKSKNGG